MIALLCALALAADEDLYAPAPPPDAAFVRVMHARPGGGPVTPTVGETTFPPVGWLQSTPYQVVPGGKRAAKAGDATKAVEVAAGGFYTVVWDGKGKLQLLRDEPNTNLAKAQVCLYNLSGVPAAALKTADGKLELVADVAPGAAGCRAVNPVKADLAAFVGGAAVATFPGVGLERGAVYAAVLAGLAEKVEGAWVRGATK